MGLLNTVQQATLAAFLAIGDLARPAVYREAAGIIRDVVAGTVTPQFNTYNLPRTLFVKFENTIKDANVSLLTDQRFLFPSVDLAIEPKISDTIIDFRGKTWEIIQTLSDPASALVNLHLRSSK